MENWWNNYQRFEVRGHTDVWLYKKYFLAIQEFVLTQLVVPSEKYMSHLRGGANWCWKRAQTAMSMLTAHAANVYMASLTSVQRLKINTELRDTRQNYQIFNNF